MSYPIDKAVLSTFAASLFALINPLGVLPVFIGYAAKESREVQRWLAFLLSLTVLGLLLLFLVSGAAILKFFGITLDSFRIAGGILLLLIGINLVTGESSSAAQNLDEQKQESNLKQAESIYRKIVIPLAMPLLVGPGVIANVILYASEAEAKKDNLLFVGLAIVCIAVSFLVFAVLLSGRWLKRVLGETGLSIATRILGLLVASIGVQFITAAVSNIVIHGIAPQL
ncbi:MAG TPA: MarC family protein [Coleofasciculaceae cyanobacterium]